MCIRDRKNTVQGHIEVYYETDTDGIRISVSDTGCGIPPDKPGMIFKRFDKVDSFAQGAGLGPVSYTHLDVYKRQEYKW